MNATAKNEIQTAAHKFEKAGLGKAPFKFLFHEYRIFQACHGAPIQVGGSCDYCGTGISNWYWVKSADGKRFKVGSECIRKTGDKGLIKIVKKEEAKKRRAKTAEKNFKNFGTLAGHLCNEKTVEILKSEKHPRHEQNDYFASLSAYDYALWMFQKAGAKGRNETVKKIETILGGVQ